MTATLTSKGQLTLPKSIRDQLRLRTGDKLEFFIRADGHIEAVPKRSTMIELKALIPPPRTNIDLESIEAAIIAGAIGNDRY